jgi:HK97 gp10 family phage protein
MDGELKGAAELKLALGQIAENVRNKHMRTALRAGAKVIRGECIEHAPNRTGATGAAIKVRAGKRRKGFVSMLVNIGRGLFQGKTYYAGFVNYGWTWKPHKSARFQLGGDQDEKKIPGTRWLNKAFAASAGAAQEAIKTSLTESLAEEAAASKALK